VDIEYTVMTIWKKVCVSDLVVNEEREGNQAMAHLRRVESLVSVLLEDRSRIHERFAILGLAL
jgi:hypothetical protein